MRVGTPGFIKERLREAREARGLSVTQLAELLALSKQAISSYEKGESTPSPEVASQIAEKLNFPRMFFLSSPERYELNTVYFRSIASTTKASRDMAKWKLRWFKDIIHYLRQYFVIPTPQLPLSDETHFTNLSDSDIETLSQQLRGFWGIGNGAISNPTLLLENKGILVGRGMFGSSTMDALSEWDKKINLPFIFLSSDKVNPFRSRFDLCHELGHLILHQGVNQEILNVPENFRLIENQAHRFASAFLLPEDTFARDIRKVSLDSFLDLKDKWRVSAKAMIKRSLDLGIISEDYGKQLFVSYSKRGYNTNGEPGDSSSLLESPRFMRRCFEALVEKQLQTPNDILANLNVPKDHILEIASLPSDFFKNEADIKLEVISHIANSSNVIPLRGK